MGNVDRCVMCGEIIPEGRQVCPICEARILKPAEFRHLYRQEGKDGAPKKRTVGKYETK